MPKPDEHLQAYAQTGDERAFGTLVDAHLGMVFGAAMRRTGDRGLSEEICQSVFTALAKKAGEIRSAAALPAWLHRAAVLECSKAIRGEARRRKRMEKLIEITALEGEGLAVWKHAASDLDEAVDELPAADREILLQRFYEDKSFREIANSTGKSEAASQKQVSRALQKLGELMRARGFAVPAAVLAAGLGSELASAAPANLAATISNSALATAGAGAAAAATATAATVTSTKTGILAAMSISNSTAAGVAVALLLIAAFTGGGYLSGRSSANSDLAADADKDAAARSRKILLNSGDRPVGSGGSNAAGEPVPRGSVREILQAAAEHFIKAREIPAADLGGEREIAKLRPDEIETALAELDMLDAESAVLERLRAEIVHHWARSDGLAAAELALGDARTRALNSALKGWSEHSPAAAYAWYREALERDENQFGASEQRSFLRTLIRGWAAKDPVEALRELASLPYDEQRSFGHAFGQLSDDAKTRTPFLEALRDFPEPKLRATLVDDAMDRWAKRDPVAAAGWFDTLEFGSAELRFKPAAELAENWFNIDARAAVDWLWGKTPEHMHGEFIDEFVRKEWASKDAAGAAAWLKENGFE